MAKVKEYIKDNNYLMKYIKDKELANVLGSGSNEKILWSCPQCQEEKLHSPSQVKRRGFNCQICNEGVSYPEKLMEKILLKKEVDYKKQVKFKECKNKYPLPFDFAIYNEGKLQYLVEMDGEQHYSLHVNSKWNIESIRINDSIKNKYCKDNNINLIRIKSYPSEFEHIIEQIKNTELNYILKGIDLYKVRLESINQYRKLDIEYIIEEHKKGLPISKISKELGTTNHIVTRILKNLGHYEPRQGNKNNSRTVICLNNKLLFHRMDEAIKYVGLKQQTNITAVCRGRREYCGKVDGEKARWMYYDEYVEQYGYIGLSCPLQFK